MGGFPRVTSRTNGKEQRIKCLEVLTIIVLLLLCLETNEDTTEDDRQPSGL
jgi:hypothetical protein